MSERTILFIGFVWPEPASTAAGHRILQLIHFFLREKYRVVFSSAAAETPLTDNLGTIGVECIPIKLNDPSFDEFIRDLKPEIVVFDRFLTEEQFGWRVAQFAPHALRILDTEDLHSLRRTREELHNKNKSIETRTTAETTLIAWRENDVTKREVASIYRCDLSLIISGYEMELLIDKLGIDDRLMLHLPFMLENLKSTTIQNWPPFQDRKDFVCIGCGKHAPNVDAVLWLHDEIWPLIRKQLPEAQLHIYGAYLPKRILQINDPKRNIHVFGWAEDVDEVLQNSRINLAPLRFGAGIKGKLVDAMQSGTPSITTSIGCEGMHSGLPWSGAIKNTATEFAEAAVNLYQNSEEWSASQENGIAIINSLYDGVSLSSKLSKSINQIKDDLTTHRRKNFIGAMLMHHSMMGTKYMAKWISAKGN